MSLGLAQKQVRRDEVPLLKPTGATFALFALRFGLDLADPIEQSPGGIRFAFHGAGIAGYFEDFVNEYRASIARS